MPTFIENIECKKDGNCQKANAIVKRSFLYFYALTKHKYASVLFDVFNQITRSDFLSSFEKKM